MKSRKTKMPEEVSKNGKIKEIRLHFIKEKLMKKAYIMGEES